MLQLSPPAMKINDTRDNKGGGKTVPLSEKQANFLRNFAAFGYFDPEIIQGIKGKSDFFRDFVAIGKILARYTPETLASLEETPFKTMMKRPDKTERTNLEKLMQTANANNEQRKDILNSAEKFNKKIAEHSWRLISMLQNFIKDLKDCTQELTEEGFSNFWTYVKITIEELSSLKCENKTASLQTHSILKNKKIHDKLLAFSDWAVDTYGSSCPQLIELLGGWANEENQDIEKRRLIAREKLQASES